MPRTAGPRQSCDYGVHATTIKKRRPSGSSGNCNDCQWQQCLNGRYGERRSRPVGCAPDTRRYDARCRRSRIPSVTGQLTDSRLRRRGFTYKFLVSGCSLTFVTAPNTPRSTRRGVDSEVYTTVNGDVHPHM